MRLKVKIQTLLQNEWFIAGCLLIIFLAANGYHYGWDDHHLEIPLLKSLIDNTLYQGDYYVESLKKKYTSFFYPLLARLITIEQIPSVYFILYLISRYFLFFWIYKIWQLITKEKATAFLCTFVFIVMGRVEEFLYRTFSHQEFTLAIIFAGLYFFYKERFILASIILGLSINFHAHYGLIGMTYIFFYLLFHFKKYHWRVFLKSCLLFCLLSLPFLFWTLQRILQTQIFSNNSLSNDWLTLYLNACPTAFMFGDVRLGELFSSLTIFLKATQDYLLLIVLFILNFKYNSRFRNDSKAKLIAFIAFASIFISFFFSYVKPIQFFFELDLLRHTQFLKFLLMGYTTILVIDVIKKSTPFFNFLIAIGFSLMMCCNFTITLIATLGGVFIFLLLFFRTYQQKEKSHVKNIVIPFCIISLLLCGVWIISLFVQSAYMGPRLVKFCIVIILLAINYDLMRWEKKILNINLSKKFFIIIPLIIRFIFFVNHHIYWIDMVKKGESTLWHLQNNWEDMQRFVKISTPKDALLLVPYDMEMGGFRIFSERKIICSYRDCSLIGFDHPAALEWQKRINDIAAFKVFPNRRPIISSIVTAITKYKPDYIVFMRYYEPLNPYPYFEKIYQNDEFSLFKVNINSPDVKFISDKFPEKNFRTKMPFISRSNEQLLQKIDPHLMRSKELPNLFRTGKIHTKTSPFTQGNVHIKQLDIAENVKLFQFSQQDGKRINSFWEVHKPEISCWMEIIFSSDPQIIKGYKVTGTGQDDQKMLKPLKCILQGSNDGEKWNDLDINIMEGQGIWSKFYNITQPRPYKGYRFYFTTDEPVEKITLKSVKIVL